LHPGALSGSWQSLSGTVKPLLAVRRRLMSHIRHGMASFIKKCCGRQGIFFFP
jgi:hypothetical protein